MVQSSFPLQCAHQHVIFHSFLTTKLLAETVGSRPITPCGVFQKGWLVALQYIRCLLLETPTHLFSF